MSIGVFFAVLAAAAMHAGWNATLKVKLEPIVAMTLVAGACGVIGLPFLLAFGFPRFEAWPWLAASVALHLAYYLTLSEAYRRADMSQVYPIARGGAPLLTTVAALLVLHDGLSTGAVAGIVILGSGIMVMSLGGRSAHGAPDPAALGYAALTACTISAYTLADGLGARAAGDPHSYAAALFVLDALPLPAWLAWTRGRAAFRSMRAVLPLGLAGGAMSYGAYWIAIWAMTVAPIAVVAALRETSVLFGALIAVVILKEPLLPARVVASVLIVAGIAVMRLG